MQEFICEGRDQLFSGSFYNASEGFAFVILTVYYWCYSKNWVPIAAYGLIINIAAFFILIFVPESPKFLYARERYEECQEVISLMKTINGISSN